MRYREATTFLLTHFLGQVSNRLKGEIYRNSTVVRYYPFSLNVDLTSACNMRCPFCSTEKYRSENPSRHLSFSNAQKLLNKFNKAFFVSLCGAGETFLNPDLFAIARYASQLKMKVLITTNGTLLYKRMEELLTSKIHTLEISLKGVCGEDYARFTGRKEAEFYLIINSIKKLSKSRNRPRLQMSYVFDRKRTYNIPKMIEIAKQCEVDELLFYNLIPSREFKNESYCLYEEDKQWVSRILDNHTKELGRIVINGPGFYSHDSIRKKCRMPFKSLRIGPDGGVSGCGRAISPSLENGNAFIDNNVFNSEHFRKLRYELVNNNIPLRYECLYCDLRL